MQSKMQKLFTKMFFSTQFRLILSIAALCLLVGVLSLIVGSRLINRGIFSEATNRISQDLNSAWEIYANRHEQLTIALKTTALSPEFVRALRDGDSLTLLGKLNRLSSIIPVEFAGVYSIVDKAKSLSLNGTDFREYRAPNPFVDLCLKSGIPVSGTAELSADFLREENLTLAERAHVALLPTPMADERTEKEENDGMAVGTGVPIYDGVRIIGVVYAGTLLNRATFLVDRIKDIVFRQETYKGLNIGTATIFYKDIRISTNVLDTNGLRAIGTRVSKQVKEHVLDSGQRWTGRAFVVNNWYITAYDPIVDIFGDRIGMLYVGVLESKYTDLRRQTLTIFIIIITAGLAIAILLGYALGRMLLKPIDRLITVSENVSKGDLSPDIGPTSKTEIGILQNTFLAMLTSLKEREEKERLDSENKLLQSEKQASVGRLAAGVAHEINNPLTAVLTFAHLLLERKDLPEDARSDLKTISDATERVREIVRGLLDFSRQSTMNPETTDINELVTNAVALLENQAAVKNISLTFKPGDRIPDIKIDRSQIQSALINIILNAIDATDSGGTVLVLTGISVASNKPDQRGLEIMVSDTGHGISDADMDKLFDPFFTTKDAGKGTGLGLAVSLGIIERHGGNITVRSKVGEGSAVTIWIPTEGK